MKLIQIKILKCDKKRLEKFKEHENEFNWQLIKRMLDYLEERKWNKKS